MRYKARCEDRVYFDIVVDSEDLSPGETLEELVGRKIAERRIIRRMDFYDLLDLSPEI